MMDLLKKQHGMNVIGEGWKIMLYTTPALIAAVLMQAYMPETAALPREMNALAPIGYLLLLIGIIFWATAVIQLLMGFPKGKLITTGAYKVVRNPIYSSVTFFVLPAVTLITQTWVYLVASVFLYAGVMTFIGGEEKQLTEAYGKEYTDYTAKVDRMIPYRKPGKK